MTDTPLVWKNPAPDAAQAPGNLGATTIMVSSDTRTPADRIADLERQLAAAIARAEAAEKDAVPKGWVAVPEHGTLVSAKHPITCLNPEPEFAVHQVRVDSMGTYVKGENTCWFGIKSIAAIDAAQGSKP